MSERSSCPKNQKIVSQLVNREVILNFDQTVDFVLQHPDSEDAKVIQDMLVADYEGPCIFAGWIEIETDEEKSKKQMQDYLPDEDDFDEDPDGWEEAKIKFADNWKEATVYNSEDKKFSDVYDWEELAYENDIDPEYSEIYEYWAVSTWFGSRLEEKGECVTQFLDAPRLWGRCCTGQAISMDNVIFEIASDMEILVGQANDWSKQE